MRLSVKSAVAYSSSRMFDSEFLVLMGNPILTFIAAAWVLLFLPSFLHRLRRLEATASTLSLLRSPTRSRRSLGLSPSFF